MTPQEKDALAHRIVNLCIAHNASLGELLDVLFSVCHGCVLTHHGGDMALASAGMREALEQALSHAATIFTPEVLSARPGRLDS